MFATSPIQFKFKKHQRFLAKPKAKQPPSPDMITTAKLSAISGITGRQLQWWDEKRIVHPEQHGHTRWWSRRESAVACIIFQLRAKGISLQFMRLVARAIRSSGELPQFVVIAHGKRNREGHYELKRASIMTTSQPDDLLRIVLNHSTVVVAEMPCNFLKTTATK